FTNNSKAVNPDFHWSFGDGAFSTETNPVHYYAHPEAYDVRLHVTDNLGCRDSIGFKTTPPLEIFVPNSFTPNGDGVNDLFGAEGTNISEFEMQIFNRWGSPVFHS